MATPIHETEHVKRVVRNSQTYYEVLHKLGLGLGHYEWIVNFVKRHRLEMQELDFSEGIGK